MNLFFEFVEKSSVQNAGVFFFRRDDDGVGFLDCGDVVPRSGDDVLFGPCLENFLQLFTLMSVGPQDKNGVSHSPALRPWRFFSLFRCQASLPRTRTVWIPGS